MRKQKVTYMKHCRWIGKPVKTQTKSKITTSLNQVYLKTRNTSNQLQTKNMSNQ